MFIKIGDWARVQNVINNLQKAALEAQTIALRRWGAAAESIAKKHISNQDLSWKPLSKRYLHTKTKAGYSENILVRSSSYFQSITSWVYKDTALVGVKKTAKNKDGQIIANIAAVHEFGSIAANIPARPLWKPTLKQMVFEVQQKPKFFNPAHILNEMLKKY